jgi:hypothetical protein
MPVITPTKTILSTDIRAEILIFGARFAFELSTRSPSTSTMRFEAHLRAARQGSAGLVLSHAHSALN